MNKKQIIRVMGAVVLVTAGAFAGRATKKFNSVGSLYYTKPGLSCTAVITGGSITGLLTTGNTTTQATMKTAGGLNSYNLYSTVGCGSAHQVHFKG
jgi:hypothetical protein